MMACVSFNGTTSAVSIELVSFTGSATVGSAANKEDTLNERFFYYDLYRLINGKTDILYIYSKTIANYFDKEESKGSYLIAEEYIRKIIAKERDENGYITLPEGIASEQIKFLEMFPDIYEAENNRIKVKNYNLTHDENVLY